MVMDKIKIKTMEIKTRKFWTMIRTLMEPNQNQEIPQLTKMKMKAYNKKVMK